MAEFRYIHTRIWKDNWFCDLEEDAKLLFIYLFSNERASVSGIYELPLKYLVFETGLEKTRVLEIMGQFQVAKKVFYEDGIVWVVNLRKYNETSSDKVQTRLSKDIAVIPDSNILRIYCQHHNIPYPYRIDTPPNRDRDGDGNDNRDNDETGDNPPPPFSDDPVLEDIYRRVTNQITMPAERRENCLTALRAVLYDKKTPQAAMDYLFPFWEAWTDKEHDYSRTNTAWLTDCAVTGQMPPPKKGGNSNGNGHKPAAPAQTAEEKRAAGLQRARERYANNGNAN